MVKGFGKLLVLALMGFCFAPHVSASLTGDINAIVTRKSQRRAHFTVKVVNATTGKTDYDRCADELMTPASNMKLVAAASALHYLGADYEFTTLVALHGRSLIVIGGGDPLFCDPQTDKQNGKNAGWLFEDIAKALKELNISSLDEIIIDNTFFDRNPVCPNWEPSDLNQEYACEVSGLNFNLNCIQVSAKKSGSTPIIMVEPQTNYFKFINEMKPISKGRTAIGVYHNSTPNTLLVGGTCAPGKGASANVAIKKPSAFFGVLLAENLAKSGIGIPDKIVEKYAKNNKDLKVIRAYKTPIRQVLFRCNKDSLNLAAEAFVKTISAENTTGRINGEWPHGQTLIARYLHSLGIKDAYFHLDDGSGLSRENKLTANVIAKVLLSMYRSNNWDLFRDSLAVAGTDGTIEKYFTSAPYKGSIIGKTGYINGVRAFSGVATTPKGDYIFSILSKGGDSSTRHAINDIAEAIIDNIK